MQCVFAKGSCLKDRDQYLLIRRLNRGDPALVGFNLFDYRRQLIAFLSPRAMAMRRFALVGMTRQLRQEQTILFG